jgi:cyclin-dependent kinase 3/cyclin-dependent kinase 2
MFALKENDYSEDSTQGIPAPILREISSLKELGQLNHPNLVQLLDVIPMRDKIGLVFEYC